MKLCYEDCIIVSWEQITQIRSCNHVCVLKVLFDKNNNGKALPCFLIYDVFLIYTYFFFRRINKLTL